MTDNINQPAHYTAGGIETIDVIEQVLDKYDHRDQVEKYNQRAHLKGNFQQDLEKARWYLNRTIENCEKGKLDPVTGSLVDTAEEKEKEEDAKKFDPATVHRDAAGDYWVFDDPTQAWNWYTLSEDLSSVEKHGGTYTVEEIENHFDTYFIKPVALMRTERLVRAAVAKFNNPEIKIVLGETDPEDMPVGTVAYRDGERFAYSVRKEVDGWTLSHQPFFIHTNDRVAYWFKSEEGWSLEPPSDVYKDEDGDYWVYSDEGWRWHCISDGELLYRSIRPHKFESINETYSLLKLNADDARRIRRIIQEGEK